MIKLRVATLSDSEFCYQLRILPQVMKNSFKKTAFTPNSHKKWFLEKLENHDYYFFIIMLKNTRIGQVRIELKDKVGEISIAILSEYSNKGYGSISILQACSAVFSSKKSLVAIKAHIMISNFASKKAFEKCGFVGSNIVNYQATKCFELILHRNTI